MKTLSTIILISILFSGCGGIVPEPERPVTFWTGAPLSDEGPSICRIKTEDLQDIDSRLIDIPPGELEKYINTNDETVCIPTGIKYFGEFKCQTAEDLGVVLRYVETLIKALRDCQAQSNILKTELKSLRQ